MNVTLESPSAEGIIARYILAMGFLALALAAIGSGVLVPKPPLAEPPPAIFRPVDQPRCFPAGVVLPEGGFLMCPDTQPNMRSA